MVDPVTGKAFYGASDDGRVFDARRTTIAVGGPPPRPGATDPLAKAVPGQASAGHDARDPRRFPPTASPRSSSPCEPPWMRRGATAYQFRLVDGSTELPGVRGGAGHGRQARPRPVARAAQGRAGRRPGVRSTGSTASIGLDRYVPLATVDRQRPDGDLRAGAARRGPRRPATSPHVIYGLASDTCASCHAAHDAKGLSLLRQPDPQSSTCFTCHDGTGAPSDVQSDWSSSSIRRQRPDDLVLVLPPRHVALEPHSRRWRTSSGARSTATPRAPTATSRTSPTATRPVNSVGGWTASGAIAGASGVSVANGAAGTAPTYTLPDDIDLRVRALLQVPLRLHAAARAGSRPPEPVGAGQGHRAQPGQRLLPPGRGRGQEPDERRWR